jgi:restriction system protein
MSECAPIIRGVRAMKVYAVAAVLVAVGTVALGAPWRWALVAGAVGPLLVVPATRFLAAAVSGAFTPSAREDAAGRAQDMSGTEFEDYVARVARSSGLPVIMTPLSGDWGVDLIVGRRPDRLAIQCKRVSRPVGPAAVQEVVAGAPMQDCTRTMVVTNHEYTPAARRLAERHGCRLVDGAQLPQLPALIRKDTAPGPLA